MLAYIYSFIHGSIIYHMYEFVSMGETGITFLIVYIPFVYGWKNFLL